MAKRFDKALERATDSTLLETNWDAILECVDLIRGNEVPAKTAMTSIRKRIHAENPHSALHGLHVLEACVKNCGARIHTEISTREFMEEFKNLGIESKADTVKNKVLELLQCWAMAFAARPEYKMVVDTHNLMKLAGFDFPSIKEADAMFAAQVAPEWAEGDECYRCRSAFGLLTRKHHCRACGQIFCDRCSSQQMLLPQFGIEKPVRVCETCFNKDAPKPDGRGQPHPFTIKSLFKKKSSTKVVTSEPSAGGGGGGPKTEAQARAEAAERERQLQEKEEEELALALAISQSEQEAKEQERSRNLASLYNGSGGLQPAAADTASLTSFAPSDITIGGAGGYKGTAEEPVTDLPADDPLARYLNRDYWQQKKEGGAVQGAPVKSDGPSAPLPSESSFNSVAGSAGATLVGTPPPQMAIQQQEVVSSLAPSDQAEEAEVNAFCASLKEQIDVMVNRIRSSTMRGRSIANDVGIQQLFLRLTEAHAGVLGRMNHIDVERSYLESLQDHVAHSAEARQAVDALREEHALERRQREEERQRVKQQQMMTKLEMMRQKKHEMLLYQRHVALQKFQEQEMQARRGGGGVGQPMPYYQQQPGVAYPQQQQQYQAHAGYAGQQQSHPPPYGMQQGHVHNGQSAAAAAAAAAASAGAMNGQQQQQHYAYQQQQYGQQYPQQQHQQQYAQYAAPAEQHHYAQPSQPGQPAQQAQQQYQDPAAQHVPAQQYPDQQQHYQAPMQQQQQYQQPAAAAAPVAAPEPAAPVKEELLISFD